MKRPLTLLPLVSFVTFLCVLIVSVSFLAPAFADGPPTPLYRQPARSLKMEQNAYDDDIATSPKPGWHRLPEHRSRRKRSSPWWADALLWIPNRVMDFVDIFRVDLGAGPAIGGVVRVSKYGQVGYRRMYPFSLRVGGFGRKIPFLIETTDERGAGDTFRQSTDRAVCEYELGLGVDLGIGGYAGVCGAEIVDFFAGLLFIDLEADDI